MAAADHPVPEEKSLQSAADALALYPVDAFQFVEEGLAYTVNQIRRTQATAAVAIDPTKSRHLTGQELSEGLRQYALIKWGLLAGTVLRRWNITNTHDFGRIVYALIDAGRMQKTDEDDIEDFKNVYDFKTAFEGDYRIEHKP
jgi:uncharacterized repeat protein (TIGR04138 family)